MSVFVVALAVVDGALVVVVLAPAVGRACVPVVVDVGLVLAERADQGSSSA